MTAAEWQVLVGAGVHGETSRETAERLGWTKPAVDNLRASAKRKLGARNLPHAVHMVAGTLRERGEYGTPGSHKATAAPDFRDRGLKPLPRSRSVERGET